MRALILFNTTAGICAQEDARARADAISELCRQLSIDAEVRAVPGLELRAEVERAASDPAIGPVVLAGGDGTINAGASALVGTGKPLGILPLGTLNHFARDLGIPLELEEALALVASGQTRDVDVAEVNERVFVNNCSIGLYPEAVLYRERLRRSHGWSKWSAMCRGAWETLRRFPVQRLTLRLAERSIALRTPQLVVGNNAYESSLLKLGRRLALDRGELWVYAARDHGRFGFLRFVLRGLLGRLDQRRDFEAFCARELELEPRRTGRRVRVALDGELAELPAPLRFRSCPRALTVIAPGASS